jgi:hypothetical protein
VSVYPVSLSPRLCVFVCSSFVPTPFPLVFSWRLLSLLSFPLTSSPLLFFYRLLLYSPLFLSPRLFLPILPLLRSSHHYNCTLTLFTLSPPSRRSCPSCTRRKPTAAAAVTQNISSATPHCISMAQVPNTPILSYYYTLLYSNTLRL